MVAGGRRGKDGRKLNELAPMLPVFRLENQLEMQVQNSGRSDIVKTGTNMQF